MGYKEALARNVRLLFWGKVFLEVKALAVVAVLFFLHRGITIEQVFYLSIFWSITNFVAEVPSGNLADRIGRKRTIIVGILFCLAASFLRIYAYGFVQFVLIFILFSLGFSCISGTEEALLYDSLKEIKREQEMQELYARLRSAKFVAKLVAPVVVALFFKDLFEKQFQFLVRLDIAITILALIVISFIKEPKIRNKKLAQSNDILKRSLATIFNHPWLIRATVSKLVLFFAGFLIFRAYQPFLKDHGASVAMIAVFFVITRGGLFLVFWFNGRLLRILGTARMINASAIIAVIFLALSLVIQNIWLLIAILAVATVMVDVRDPLYSKAINQRIKSDIRATTLSVLNMIKSILDIPMLLLVGWLTTFTINNAIIGAIVLCLIAIIFLWSKEKEFDDIKL